MWLRLSVETSTLENTEVQKELIVSEKHCKYGHEMQSKTNKSFENENGLVTDRI